MAPALLVHEGRSSLAGTSLSAPEIASAALPIF
jgi:hypothetical protein